MDGHGKVTFKIKAVKADLGEIEKAVKSRLDRLGRCIKLFESTDIPSCHELASQFGLAFLCSRKSIAKTVSRTSVCCMNKRAPVEKRRNTGHGRSIASDSMSGDNSDHSGDRLSQNGEKQQVKPMTTRVYSLPSRLENVVE